MVNLVNRRFVLSLVVFISLVASSAQAAIPVIDTQNILQQLKTYEQEAMTVINTAKQVQLQAQELLSLPTSIMNSFKSLTSTEISALQSLLTNTTGMLNPNKSLDDLWISMFKPAGDLTKTNITAATASAASASTIKATDTVNYESFKIVKTAISTIEQSQSNIDQLLELNSSAEGQKQAGQIQNMLLAEQAKIMQQQNVIRAAEANARITYYQRQNQLDAMAQVLAEQAAESIEKMDVSRKVFQ